MSEKIKSAESIWLQARRHALGDTIPVDLDIALELMREAASVQISERNGEFAFQLGRNLATGIYYSDREDESGAPRFPSMRQDMAEAEAWFRKAVDVGYWPSTHWFDLLSKGLNDGELFREMSDHVDSNWEFTKHPWLLAGCRLGDAEACMHLSACIHDRWPWQTYFWEERVSAYRKGRELGHRHLGILWIIEDKCNSRELQLKKAKAGYLPAQVDIGTRFAGSGEHIEAYAWLKTAFSDENQWSLKQKIDRREASSALWFLERVLDDQELTSAKSLAESYVSKYRPRKIGLIQRVKWFGEDFEDFAYNRVQIEKESD